MRTGEVVNGTLRCSCGARQTSVAASPTYFGLMFGCEKYPHGCRSQDEGSFSSGPPEFRFHKADAVKAAKWFAAQYHLRYRKVGALDSQNRPKEGGKEPAIPT